MRLTFLASAPCWLLAVVLLSTVNVCSGEPDSDHWNSSIVSRTERQLAPQWTPDGSHVVLPAGRGSIYTVKADGSDLRRIAKEDGFYVLHLSPDVSPDSSRLVYATSRHKLKKDDAPNRERRSFDIETARLDGSDRRRLTDDFHLDTSPVWSPDGERIAWAKSPYTNLPNAGIYTMAPDGSDKRRIVDYDWMEPAGEYGARATQAKGAPAWSRDGSRLAFVVYDGGSPVAPHNSLYTVNADGTDLRRMFTVELRIPYGTSVRHTLIVGQPKWSPDGRKLAFFRLRIPEPISRQNELTLYIISSDGSDLREVWQHRFVGLGSRGPRDSFHLEWSPDSSRLLFSAVSEEVYRDWGPYVATHTINADGSGLREVGTGGHASWSPDGSRIAMSDPAAIHVMDDYTVAADGYYTVAADGSDRRELGTFDSREGDRIKRDGE